MTVKYVDPGENSTVEYGEAMYHWIKPKQEGSWENYQKEAKKLLEKLSKTYNPMGINMLIGAMIEENLK